MQEYKYNFSTRSLQLDYLHTRNETFIGNDFKCRPLIKNTQRNILLQQVVPLLHKPINAGSIVTFDIIKNLGNKTS